MTIGSNPIKDALKEAECGQLSRSRPLIKNTEDHAPVQIRMFAREGGFHRSVSCQPGEFTIIEVEPGGEFETLPAVLLAQWSPRDVQIRKGANALSVQDFEIVSGADLPEDASARDLLMQVSKSSRSTESLLSSLNLQTAADVKVDTLPDTVRNRIAIAMSIYSTKPVVVYDWPLLTDGCDDVERIASCLADGRTVTRSASIFLGVADTPDAWKEEPFVTTYRLVSCHEEDLEESVSGIDAEVENSLRNLIKQNRMIEEQAREIVLANVHNKDGLHARTGTGLLRSQDLSEMRAALKAMDLVPEMTCRDVNKETAPSLRALKKELYSGQVEAKLQKDIETVTSESGVLVRPGGPLSALRVWFHRLFR